MHQVNHPTPTEEDAVSWRTARAIKALFDELNAAAPKRSRLSDGTIGDAAHRSRDSDHNPWVQDGSGVGVVTAGDLTDDDAAGADMSKLVDYFTRISHDERIKYLIHRGRIYSSYPAAGAPAWAARPYDGLNAHMHHLHVSVNKESRHYDDSRSWGVAKALNPPKPKPKLARILEVRHPMLHGEDVKTVQRIVRTKVDGWYGPDTAGDVKRWQRAHGLSADGEVGPKTAAKMGLRWAG
jgi:hypothetical protein